MSTPIYPEQLASADDYSSHPGVPAAPSNIDAILEACTGIVIDATLTARYDVDSDGFATDPAIKKALADATVLQAAVWVTLKIDPNMGGVVQAGARKSKRLASGAIEYADADTAGKARAAAHVSLVPAAVRKLARMNLLDQPVGVWS